jgi:hypothetical protein
MTKFPIPELKKRKKSIMKIEGLSYETTSSRARPISSALISPKRKSSRSPKSFGSSSLLLLLFLSLNVVLHLHQK